MPKYVETGSSTHLVEDYGPALIQSYCGREFDRDEYDLDGGPLPDDGVCRSCEKAAE